MLHVPERTGLHPAVLQGALRGPMEMPWASACQCLWTPASMAGLGVMT